MKFLVVITTLVVVELFSIYLTHKSRHFLVAETENKIKKLVLYKQWTYLESEII